MLHVFGGSRDGTLQVVSNEVQPRWIISGESDHHIAGVVSEATAAAGA